MTILEITVHVLFEISFSFILLQIEAFCIIYIMYICKEYMFMKIFLIFTNVISYTKITFFHYRIITWMHITYLMAISSDIFIRFDDV